MPESVTDRPTNSWEPIFLLAKNGRYFYDAEAVKEPNSESTEARADIPRKISSKDGIRSRDTSQRWDNHGEIISKSYANPSGRNQRNVWGIPAQLYRMRSDLTSEQKEKLVAELLRRGII